MSRRREPNQVRNAPVKAGRARPVPPSEAAAIGAIERVLARYGAPPGEITRGIGDDAAILKPRGGRLVWTVDVQVEGVHFDLKWLELEMVGWRSFHAAASDLAAMGARPVGALSSLVLPRGFAGLEVLVRGQARASRGLQCPVAGGNLARGSELSVTTTCLGVASKPLLRSGAEPGDELWLLGEVGLAAGGLRLLQAGLHREPGRAAARCLRAWRKPQALVEAGQKLVGRASAAVDISDGLGSEARHLAESSGVQIVLEEERLCAALRPELRQVAARLGLEPLELALEGGEDYALLLTGKARRRPKTVRVIGRVDGGYGAILERKDGTRRSVLPGYDHLGDRPK